MIAADLQPRLKSSVLTLDPLVNEDWAELYAVASDPLIWAVHPAGDRWREPAFRRFFDQQLASGGTLTVRSTASGAVVGSSRYDVGRAGADEVEIGWTFLARSLWGGPANSVLKRLMIDHALRFFDRVIFLVGEDNGRSRRAMEKIGGKLTDRVQDAVVGEKLIRHVVYSIDRGQFANGPLAAVPVETD